MNLLPIRAVIFPVREGGDVWKAAASEDVRGAADLAALRESDRAAAVDGLSEAARARARNMVTSVGSISSKISLTNQSISSKILRFFAVLKTIHASFQLIA